MGFDLLLRNGTLVDGSGMPRYRADIGIAAGLIVGSVALVSVPKPFASSIESE